jgi:hypothetical protein
MARKKSLQMREVYLMAGMAIGAVLVVVGGVGWIAWKLLF